MTSKAAVDSAVEALRAAGAGSGSWSEAVRHAARAVGADAGALVVWRSANFDFEAQEGFGFDDAMVRDYAGHFYQHDVLLHTHVPLGHWQVSDERFPDERWSGHPFFGDFLGRWRVRQITALTLHRDAHLAAGLCLHRHSRTKVVARDFQRGALARLTCEADAAFQRHRHATLAAREALHQTLVGEDATAFLADAAGRVHPLQPGDGRPDAGLLAIRHGRLFHPGALVRQRLLELVGRACQGQRGRITVPSAKGPLRIEALRAPPAARLAQGYPMALVRVERSRDRDDLPDEELLATAFGLTPAQARVLRLLCEGSNVAQCAERLHCSPATVRTHIASLMLRMDCRRQAELVRAAMLLC